MLSIPNPFICSKTLFCFFLCCTHVYAQKIPLPDMVAVNDTLFVGQFEITNNQFRTFRENQSDSIQKVLHERRALFYQEYNKSPEYAYCDFEVYDIHPYYENFPYVGICEEDAWLYMNWIQKLDTSKKYFLPTRLDYLAIYSINHEEALLNRYLCGPPLRDKQLVEAVIDSGGTFNRDYFPWGTSIYGPKGQVLANLRIPPEYRISTKSIFVKGRRSRKAKFDFNGVLEVGSMPYSYKNLYDLQGNVSEMLFESDYCFGGSYVDEASVGYIGRVSRRRAVPFDVGFRIFAIKKSEQTR